MPPRLVVTVGLHGSASTSLFNIVRELMVVALGKEAVVALFSEDPATLPTPLALERRHLVLKSHSGSPAWEWLVYLSQAPVILSIRDPRDAVLSLVERFNNPPNSAVQAVLADCRCAELCANAGHVPFRYEDRFFEDETLASQLAARLGLAVAEATCREIGSRYSTEGVRSIATNLDALPPDRVHKSETLHYDQVTQIHRHHIGDGLTGKWRERIAPPDGARLTQLFGPFIKRFGYDP